MIEGIQERDDEKVSAALQSGANASLKWGPVTSPPDLACCPLGPVPLGSLHSLISDRVVRADSRASARYAC
jgi:hypothetical protein